jgi:hypothetical protein
MRVALKTGAYVARSVIANCQRSVNLYAEANPEDAPVPFSYYPTPGLRALSSAPTPAAGRGLYRASNGALYAVVGRVLYKVASDWTWRALGTLSGYTLAPVGMADNQTTLFLTAGAGSGYTVDLATDAFLPVSDVAFYGSPRAEYVDGRFVFSKPNTAQFYLSDFNATTFDPLYFAAKIGASDLLVTAAVVHREIWLIGQRTTEIWINSGGASFPYEIMNGAFIQHGCEAVYSVAQMGDALFWLASDDQGGRVVLRGQGYQTQRVSTHAIETALAGYSTVADAVAYTYQQEGHQFYVLTLPTADKTWCLDIVSGQWHERMWLDGEGREHRHRGISAAYVYGENVVQDWETGQLYAFDLNVYTDNGAPIVRRRGFPHMGLNGQRVYYREFIADMEVGRDPGSLFVDPGGAILGPDVLPDTGLGVDSIPVFLGVDMGTAYIAPSKVYLRWSNTRGQSWSNPVESSLGATGDFFKVAQFTRLGMARDRVFELFWSAPVRTALNGAFVDAKGEQ